MSLAALNIRPDKRPSRKMIVAKEMQLHMAVVNHLRHRVKPGVWWAHYPAGEIREPRAAAKLKAMGTKAGVPDLLLIINGVSYGLEIKRSTGRLTDCQRLMHAEMDRAGAVIATAYDIDSAVEILRRWGAISG